MKALAAIAAVVVLAVPGGSSVRYLESRQDAGGGFAEPGRAPTPGLTAWAVLGLQAAGRPANAAAARYLATHEDALTEATDLELALLAESAAGRPSERLLARLRALVRPSGAIGPAVNSTVWGALAFRAVGQPVPPATVRYLLARQARSGGWPWLEGATPDSNDTAAAVEALSAAGVRGPPIARALAYLRRLRNGDGGFELAAGRGSDAQSTAWAIQAYVAAGRTPPAGAFRYLARLRRRDGSYRYSARYAATPVWVTAQVLPALARKPFPLR